MRYSGMGGLGSNSGGPHRPTPDTRATLSGQGITAVRSTEGKAAKAFVDKMNVMVFNEAIFAELVIAIGGDAMTPRVMEIVKALIRNLADSYDCGIVNAATIEAKRLLDTMEHYRM